MIFIRRSLCGPTRKINRLQPPRYSWLNNHPIGKQYDEEHSLHRSSKRIRETEKPMWNWTFEKFLSFDYSGLHVIENRHPVGGDFYCLLLAYGLWSILFVSLENIFKLSTILDSVSISKQLNRNCWNRQQEADQDCRNAQPVQKRRAKQCDGRSLGACFQDRSLS